MIFVAFFVAGAAMEAIHDMKPGWRRWLATSTVMSCLALAAKHLW